MGASRNAGHFRLERHSADRTITRVVPANLGVHRAGVDRALRLRHLGMVMHVLFRMDTKRLAALDRTEVISLLVVVSGEFAFRRIGAHSANRIVLLSHMRFSFHSG